MGVEPGHWARGTWCFVNLFSFGGQTYILGKMKLSGCNALHPEKLLKTVWLQRLALLKL